MRTGHRFHATSLGTLLLATALLGAAEASAQLAVGRVVEAGTDRGLRDATVSLVDSAGAVRTRVVTDSTGTFRVLPPLPGSYRINVELIGYATVETGFIELRVGQRTELELRLSPAAVPLEPLRIIGRSSFDAGRLTEYYQRVEWSRRLGRGRTFVRDEIEALNLPNVTNIFLFGGPRFAGCPPTLLLDGLPVGEDEIDMLIQPVMVEGVEIYRGVTQLPPEFEQYTPCGVILVWSRRDAPQGRPMSRWRVAIILGAALGVLFLIR